MALRRVSEWHHLVWAAGILNTTQVRVAVSLDKVDVERMQRDYIGMFVVVGMPGDWIAVFVWTDERDS